MTDEPKRITLDPEKQPAANMLFEQLTAMRNDPSPEGRAKFEADVAIFLGKVVVAISGLELELREAERRVAELEANAPGAAGTGTHGIK